MTKLLSITLAVLALSNVTAHAAAGDSVPPPVVWKWHEHSMLEATTTCPAAIQITNISDYVWYYFAEYGPSMDPLVMWELSERFNEATGRPTGGPPPLTPGSSVTIDLTPAGRATTRVYVDNGKMLEVVGGCTDPEPSVEVVSAATTPPQPDPPPVGGKIARFHAALQQLHT